jgi:3-oxoacyl-[acyl-carrier-protein] synthase II
MNDIVVTGMGIVCPLGVGTDPVFQRLTASRSGIGSLPEEIVPDVPCKVGGQVPTIADDPECGFDPDKVIPPKEQRKMDRFIQFALVAADEAVAMSGWRPSSPEEHERTATVIASGVGGFPAMVQATRTVDEKGARRLSPFIVPSFLVNLAAGHISIVHGFKGPIGAPVTACAASVQAIGDGVRLIRSGEADVVVCGGAEACIDRVSLGGFAAARALSTGFNDRPEEASRPFDADRDGFVMGEGAGVVVLERRDHALARGARPLAVIAGYGTTADAYHITSGPEDGDGHARAMRIALADAGVSPGDIGYLNAHSTSTPVGDRGELAAIRTVFGDADVSISSTKSATGHLLGAAGAVEAIYTIQAVRSGRLPPTLNLGNPDPLAEGLDLIGPETREKTVEIAQSNGFGFGGVNASVVIRHPDA